MNFRWTRAAPRSALASFVVVFAVLLIAACGQDQAGPPGGMPPAQVGVVAVAPRTVPVPYEFTGEVEPFRRIEVRARVDGIIEERPFTEGAAVAKGDLLYRLDQVRYKAAYESAQTTYDNAARTLERVTGLLPRHAVSQQDVDNAQTAADAARAHLDEARKDFDDTEIRAEMSGRVGRTLLQVGARVSGSGDLLTAIDQLDPIYVTFHPSSDQVLVWHASATDRPLARAGSALRVLALSPAGAVLPDTGRIDFVAPALDAATGTQEFRARFPNRDGVLVPGQFVHIRVDGFTRENAITVPQRAVQQGLGRQFVYVVGQGDTVSVRDVQTGVWTGDDWIVDSGLSAGDRVVVDGVQKVFPGNVVQPTPADSIPK